MPSQSSVLQATVDPHIHISGQQCPFCEQDIPLDKLEEISGRIAAREQEWLTEATSRLRDQHAREKTQADAQAKVELEQARRDGAAAVEKLAAEAKAREATVRADATRVAEEAAQVRLEAANRAGLEEKAGLQERLQTEEQARIAAETRTTTVSAELESVQIESAAAVRKAAEDAAAREEAIRAEAARTAEAAYRDRVDAAEVAKQTADAQIADLSAQLHTVRIESAAALEKVGEDAAAREEAIRAEAVRTAETAYRDRVDAAEVAKKTADAQIADLSAQLHTVRTEGAAALQKVTEDAAAREGAIRSETARVTEAAYQERLAAAEQEKNAADAARQTAEAELRGKLAELGEQLQTLQASHANEINQQRDVLEKDKITSVNAERAKSLETQMKLETQLQDMQRQLQKRTADEHGEGAELELYEVLKAAFEDDKIRRVPKGTPGADIVHEVILNGKLCGKIVYDSKNRNRWATEYVTKLRQDQIAEKADHAILSSNKFPAGEKQLHVQEHVIIACPARVLVLAYILRNQVVQMHELRISNEARDDKMAEFYDFITSERCGQLLDSVEAAIRKIEQIEVDEQKAHRTIWTKRGELLRAVLKANGDLCFALNRITGTAETAELQ